MASAEPSRRVGKVVGYPPLSELGDQQRREFHEALLDADSFEDLPGKWQAAILKAESEPAEAEARVEQLALVQRSLVSQPPRMGVNVSSLARSWTLRSSSARDAGAAPRGCRTIRTTRRVPPHRQRAAEDPLGKAGPSL